VGSSRSAVVGPSALLLLMRSVGFLQGYNIGDSEAIHKIAGHSKKMVCWLAEQGVSYLQRVPRTPS